MATAIGHKYQHIKGELNERIMTADNWLFKMCTKPYIPRILIYNFLLQLFIIILMNNCCHDQKKYTQTSLLNKIQFTTCFLCAVIP